MAFLCAVENVAPQHFPADVRTCATTLGDIWSGRLPSVSTPLAFTWSFARPGVGLATSIIRVIPSGTPDCDLNAHPIGNALQHGSVLHCPTGRPWYAGTGPLGVAS